LVKALAFTTWFRRDLLVISAGQRSIIHSLSPGTEVPRSIWSAAIYRRFLVKALAFTTWRCVVFCRNHESCSLVGAIHELPLPTLTVSLSRAARHAGKKEATRQPAEKE